MFDGNFCMITFLFAILQNNIIRERTKLTDQQVQSVFKKYNLANSIKFSNLENLIKNLKHSIFVLKI